MSALRSPAVIVALVVTLGACGRDAASESDESGGALSESEFVFGSSAGEFERIDAMGVALTSTALTNRDRRPDGQGPGADNGNAYQNASPYILKFLPTFAHYLEKMHAPWDAQLRALGFTPCDKDHLEPTTIAGQTWKVLPCTLQKLRSNTSPDGPRVLDVVYPDYVTLSVDLPLGFPNGRVLDEQVNDAVLAMGFLDMGGKCKGDTSGKAPRDADGDPICTVQTFQNIGLNPPKNDRHSGSFNATFPYLATPWFYDEEAGHEYWPTAPRRGTP
jgi:hypothetical protein